MEKSGCQGWKREAIAACRFHTISLGGLNPQGPDTDMSTPTAPAARSTTLAPSFVPWWADAFDLFEFCSYGLASIGAPVFRFS